jgi:hypothetical protein
MIDFGFSAAYRCIAVLPCFDDSKVGGVVFSIVSSMRPNCIGYAPIISSICPIRFIGRFWAKKTRFKPVKQA